MRVLKILQAQQLCNIPLIPTVRNYSYLYFNLSSGYSIALQAKRSGYPVLFQGTLNSDSSIGGGINGIHFIVLPNDSKTSTSILIDYTCYSYRKK